MNFTKPIANKRLQASIGFSIRITDVFQGSIVWKGIIYALLMVIAKLLVGSSICVEYFLRLQKASKTNSTPNIELQTLPTEQQTLNIQIASTVSFMATLDCFVDRVCHGFKRGNRVSDRFAKSEFWNSYVACNRHIHKTVKIYSFIAWTVIICTIVGPISVGVIVRRLRNREVSPLHH